MQTVDLATGTEVADYYRMLHDMGHAVQSYRKFFGDEAGRDAKQFNLNVRDSVNNPGRAGVG